MRVRALLFLWTVISVFTVSHSIQ